jgi:hypothetical protein
LTESGYVETTAADQDVYGAAWIPASGSSPDCHLGVGDATGPDDESPVLSLQLTLNQCYGAQLVLDGVFGPKTRAALFAAQGAEGLLEDGVYGPQTRDRLKFYASRILAHGLVKSRCVPYPSLA